MYFERKEAVYVYTSSRVQVHLLLVGGDWGPASQSTRANHELDGR